MLNYVEYGKENKYDDDIFFQKYSQMSRSQQGLAGAGEWETLRKLLPDFKDKRVLDLGCGYGWHCIYAMEHGASSVVGVDISHKMLEVAKEKTHFPQIEYVEKPKRLFFQAANGRRVSCVPPVQNPPFSLFGSGVLVAIIDSGIDYTNPDFRNDDGTTRIRNLWDQTIMGNPPEGYLIGTEFTREQIDEAIKQPTVPMRMQIVPSVDVSGHGTSVAGIAAGNGRGSRGRIYRGVATQSELLVVKLGNPREEGFPRTTELMQAIDYVVRKALFYKQPVAINISFGNTYGSHEPYN